jgi:glycosidase
LEQREICDNLRQSADNQIILITSEATMSERIEKSLAEIDWSVLCDGRRYHPSPAAWEDEVLYFLFVDRFSDGREGGGFADNDGLPVQADDRRTTPLFDLDDAASAEWEAWFSAGKGWCGGTLAGLREKLGYLARLGVTAVWLSPIFKQVTGSDAYHGYGIQNFLDVDPHFGSRTELRDFVAAAHEKGIRVILDIILNHAGDVFAYADDNPYYYYRGEQWPVAGFRRNQADPGSLPFTPLPPDHPDAWPDGAVWPIELQEPAAWRRQGQIQHWDHFPEYLDGDFLALKELDHGSAPKDPQIAADLQTRIALFQVSPTLRHLTEVYKFWIAYADIDGYRIDTIKHMEPGAVRFFTNVIHEFAQSLGKENFYLIGEITGGRAHAVNILNTTGLDAALGINDIPVKMEQLAKGRRGPGNPETLEQTGYFDLFRNSLLDNKDTHQWFGEHVVTMFDDHDQVGVRHKYRFCGESYDSYTFLKAALGLNLTTMGIPCIYYGTEQGFNGADPRRDDDSYSDVFLRECMFGGPFGSLQSRERHFFNEGHEIYQFISELTALRREQIALRRGRQYLRQISESGEPRTFYYPELLGREMRWIVAWSRQFADRELLCALNTDGERPLTLWVTVDSRLHPPGRQLRCLLSTDPAQKGTLVTSEARDGAAVQITVPAAGFVVYG